MDGQGVAAVQLAHTVDCLAGHVEHSAADLGSYGHRYGAEGILYGEAAAETVGGVHGHAADGVLADVLLDLQDHVLSIRAFHYEGVLDAGEFDIGLPGRNIKMHIHDRPHDLRDVPYTAWHRQSGFQYHTKINISSQILKFS